MSHFRHPSPALIVASIAMILAVTGSAVAAGHFIITSTSQISPKVLRSLKGERGPRGYRGASGARGITGPPGPKGDTGNTGESVTTVTTETAPPTPQYYGEVIASGLRETGVGDNFDVARLSTGVYQLTFPLSIAPSDLNSGGSNGCPVVVATPLTDGITAVVQPTCTYVAGVGFEEDVDTINSAFTATNGAFNFIALPNH
jgi:hypothetical protein